MQNPAKPPGKIQVRFEKLPPIGHPPKINLDLPEVTDVEITSMSHQEAINNPPLVPAGYEGFVMQDTGIEGTDEMGYDHSNHGKPKPLGQYNVVVFLFKLATKI